MPRIIVRGILTDRRPFKFEYFEQEIRKELNTGVKQDVINDLNRTVSGWENPPTWFARVNVIPSGVSLDAVASGPNKDQYHLVVGGAKRHVIPVSRRYGYLAIQRFRAATTVGKIQSRRRVATGPRGRVFHPLVHPGFTGRDFYTLIAEKNKPEFQRRIKNALQRAERRHATALPV